MSHVFLGGTCASSTWRQELIPMLNVSYFNPVVDTWDSSAQQEELRQRESASLVLYVITPESHSLYSIAEVVDDSNKRPSKTVLCILDNVNMVGYSDSQRHSLEMLKKMIGSNGATVCDTLNDVAVYVNGYKGE